MTTIAIIQARMSSTRLPGKILKKINGNVILDYVIDRLRFCKRLDNIVLATTTSKKDDILEQYSVKKSIDYFRGSEEDVLSRYYYAVKKFKADIIVRITSDCPLIDPEIVDEVIKKHIEGSSDYTANIIKRTFPRGLDVEVFNFDVLEADFKNANKKHQREHVTPYIKEHPEKFKLKNIEAKGRIKRPDIRIAVDTVEDFKLIKKIIQYFNNLNFKTEEIIDFLDRNPDILEINKNIKQKSVRSI